MTALVLFLMLLLGLTFVVLARADRRDRAKPTFSATGRRRTSR